MSATHRRRIARAFSWLLLPAVLLASSCKRVEDGSSAAEPPEIITTAGGDEMVLIPAGSFRMGSDDGPADQAPAHEVYVDAVLMDRHEVTQKQYEKLMMDKGSHFKGPDRPEEMVSWAQAALYCNARSKAEGLEPCYSETGECNFEANGYRLPTEAEWEYACRAGSEAEFSFGPDAAALGAHAWYAANAAKETHPVGTKKPNAWGLFDMHGNVAEWCNDVYDKDYYEESPEKDPRGPAEGEKYVLRGGAWNCSAEACRCAHRVGQDPGFQDACFARDAIGFRCVRKASGQASLAAERRSSLARGVSPWDEGVCPAGSPAGAAEEPIAPPGLARIVCPDYQGLTPLANDGRPSGTAAGEAHPAAPMAGQALAATEEQSAPQSSPPAKTGFVYGDVYLEHKTGKGHPERPERLTAIVARLKRAGLLSELVAIKPRPAAQEWLTTVHAPQYVAGIKRSCQRGAGYVGSMDTPVSKESYAVALEAAGGVLAAVDAVMEGKIRNAFCAVRPPGHHALKNRAMGFCLFNNVAVAARYLQTRHKLRKVLIVDWDVHHGNGTQAMFYDDPTVFYFGVHRFPFYPGTGSADQRGEGKGLGATLNVPLPAGSGDREFKRALERQLVPAAREFKPDFVLVSAGFDAHKDDPLGGMKMTAEGYAELTRIVKGIAEEHCGGRLVSMLEGGYDLEGLAASTEAHLRVLMK